MAKIIVDGVSHPVTATFVAEVLSAHPDLSTAPVAAMEIERGALLRLSDARAAFDAPAPLEPMAENGTLTADEYDRLEALTRALNVHRAVRFLGARHHSDFGFVGVDQIHGNACHHDCGCISHTVHDHHARGTDKAVALPHRVHRACDDHAHLAHDPKAHWDQVTKGA